MSVTSRQEAIDYIKKLAADIQREFIVDGEDEEFERDLYQTFQQLGVSDEELDLPQRQITHVIATLFKPSGKYYTSEPWTITPGAIGPSDMKNSIDFRRIDGGSVLIESQEPWGFPVLFPGDPR